jgi:hypothetical protein
MTMRHRSGPLLAVDQPPRKFPFRGGFADALLAWEELLGGIASAEVSGAD